MCYLKYKHKIMTQMYKIIMNVGRFSHVSVNNHWFDGGKNVCDLFEIHFKYQK